MIDYHLLSTSTCNVGCTLCCMADKSTPNFYSIGNTELEKKALKNMLRGNWACISGGDPLTNQGLLESMVELYQKDQIKRLVMVNPISIKKMKPEKRERTLEYLSNLDVFLSTGVARGKKPDENRIASKYVKELFDENTIRYREHHLEDGQIFSRDGVNIIKYSPSILVVGRLRRLVDKGKIKGDIHFPNKLLSYGCTKKEFRNAIPGINNFRTHFEKIDGDIRLVFSYCRSVGFSKYLTWPSEITALDLANCTDPSKLVKSEYKRFQQEPFFRLMGSGLWSFVRKGSRLKRFETIAKAIIKEKTGNNVDDILQRTPTLRKEVYECEFCHSIAKELVNARISREELHQFARDEF